MSKDEVEKFLDTRKRHNRLTMDEWITKDAEQQKWFEISYWVVVDNQRERVRAVGNSLEECVEKALVKENLLEKERKDKKDKSAKGR